MKQLKRLSLTELSDRELKDRQMNLLKGGGSNIYCSQKCGTRTPPQADAEPSWEKLFD
ncbi:MAG: TIGR04149 family rSAM-modified RiPP [bacterium]|nr:TIGR04149 family rSAM-modified RiPP [bacterium]MDY4844835.1 TIGR04149 family rSAM-modified RiPP [Parabacteroides sp.]